LDLQSVLLEIQEILSINITEIKDKTLKDKKYLDINMRQYQTLSIIHKLKNPTLSNLSALLKISKPSVTAIINKLIKLGFVKKIQSDNDKRIFHIYLTDEGKKIFNAYIEANNNLVNTAFKCLNEQEIKIFYNFLERIKDSIKK